MTLSWDFADAHRTKGQKRPADVVSNAVHVMSTHRKLRMSPAMAAGIAITFMSFEGVLARIDTAQAPKLRGPHKKRQAA